MLELTLSDFFVMRIGVRPNGSLTPIIDYVGGKPVGLAGYNGDASATDLEIREDAWMYWQGLKDKLEKV